MRTVFSALAGALLLTVASPAEASTWRWKLDPDRTYAFQYRSESDIKMTLPMGLGEITDKVGIDTDFALRVQRVLPDGRYDLEIPIQGLVITSATGQRITLDDLPSEVRTMRAYMTPQGRFQFYERVLVEVREGGVYGLATMKQRGDVAEGTVTAGADGMEISASASIDPKTGRVTVSSSIKERKPATRQEEEERPVQHTDVLPADLLSLLELPEGSVTPGLRQELNTPVGNLLLQAGQPTACGKGQCGVLTMKMDADSAPVTQKAAKGGMPGMPDMGEMMAGMDEMMAGMGDMMGMGGGDAASAVPTMQVDVDATALFDVQAGRMHQVQGKAGARTAMAGMQMQDQTTFTLTFAGVK